LCGQPLVDDQRLVLPARVELVERSVAFGTGSGIDVGQHGQRGELVSHVVGAADLGER
jgi:hypothetical protein